MPIYHKPFWRAAGLVCGQLAKAAAGSQTFTLPTSQWQTLVKLVRDIQLAGDRGWRHAARRRHEELLSELDYFERSISQLVDQRRDTRPANVLASDTEVYRDLVALDGEFAEVRCDFEEQVIAVTTDPVVLDGIDLGRFQIRLNWQQLGDAQPYTIVALDPNPAAANSAVTHPHVSDEILCEGDGRRTIQAALRRGGWRISLRSSIACCARTPRGGPTSN